MILKEKSVGEEEGEKETTASTKRIAVSVMVTHGERTDLLAGKWLSDLHIQI